MLAGLDGAIDVIVPRGGKSLVARVQEEARVPVFAHLEGVCHVYVHAAADLEMAKKIVLNAKMRRTGICGAAETLLVDRPAPATHLRPLVAMLLDAGCAVRGDAAVQAADPRVTPASEDDWRTEYLDAIIAARVVDGLDAAIDHIETHGSHHTDAIVTGDQAAAERFLNEVDSAIVLHNASTQFADGGEFGFGAEIGIATGRMHARGPVGVEQLTSFKYRVRGAGPGSILRRRGEVIPLPPHAPGLRVGLYGGSFNPPHAGHRHVSLLALKRLRLDRVWWMVTPGNPLKEQSGFPPIAARLAAARVVARRPRIDVTGFEEEIGATFTVDSLSYLVARCPGVRFVWIMGADCLAGFHRWRGWETIAGLMPLAVIDRPGWTLRATQGRAAVALARARLDETDAPLLADREPPAWIYLHGPRSFLSSTALRARAHPSPSGNIENVPRLTLS